MLKNLQKVFAITLLKGYYTHRRTTPQPPTRLTGAKGLKNEKYSH
nr:MAG TPA: hypothetical protein [Caudoviricetes sp.]